MAEESDNIVLEHLRHIRRVVDRLDTRVEKIENEFIEIKSRITSFEATMGHVMADRTSTGADRKSNSTHRPDRGTS